MASSPHASAARYATVSDFPSRGSWKDIPGWEGQYQISSLGQIWRCPRIATAIRRGFPYQCHITGLMMTPVPDASGRMRVTLSAAGKVATPFVSNLVIAAFIGPRPYGMQVCHNDGNRTNDVLTNLRYDTPVGNAADRKLHGTHYVGSMTTNAKLVESQIPQIRTALANGETLTGIARRFGLKSIKAITQIRDGITWKHVA